MMLYPFLVPPGVLTFQRQSLLSDQFPKWNKCPSKFTRLHVSTTGTIEDDGTGTELRSEIKEDALKEIAAFESFIANYVVQQSSHSKVNHHDSHGCVSKQSGVNPKRNQKAQLEVPSSLNTPVSSGIPPSGPLRGRRMIANGGVVRTLERQKKIMTSQNSEEA